MVTNFAEGKIIPVESNVTVYDISLSRNVIQMLIATILFVWLMIAVAKRYKKGHGVTSVLHQALKMQLKLLSSFSQNRLQNHIWERSI